MDFKKILNILRYSWLPVAIVYFLVLAYQAVQRNVEVQAELSALEEQLQELTEEKAQYQTLLSYYKSSVFKERELRRALLLAAPNERVYALPESTGKLLLEENNREIQETAPESGAVWQEWVEYYF